MRKPKGLRIFLPGDLPSIPSTACHLDRSEAQWRDPCISPLPLPVLIGPSVQIRVKPLLLTMIHEILIVGPLQCNCSILGDETSREAIVVDPGDDISRIVSTPRTAPASPSSRSSSPTPTSTTSPEPSASSSLTGAPILYNQNDLPLVKMMDIQAAWLGIPTPEVAPPDASLERRPARRHHRPHRLHPPHPRPHRRQRLPLSPPADPSSSPETPSSPAPSAAPISPAATPGSSSSPSTIPAHPPRRGHRHSRPRPEDHHRCRTRIKSIPSINQLLIAI